MEITTSKCVWALICKEIREEPTQELANGHPAFVGGRFQGSHLPLG